MTLHKDREGFWNLPLDSTTYMPAALERILAEVAGRSAYAAYEEGREEILAAEHYLKLVRSRQ